MKNLSLILNLILALAVAYLYYLHFSQPRTSSTTEPITSSTTTDTLDGSTSLNTGNSLPIAFINSDSLLLKYDFINKLKSSLDSKQKRAEADLDGKLKALEQEFRAAQEKAPTMAPVELQKKEEELMGKQQELMALRDKLSAQLAQDEARLTNQLYDTLASFMKTYSKDKNYTYVLGYSKGGGILYADESKDITSEVLNKLNENYQKSKK